MKRQAISGAIFGLAAATSFATGSPMRADIIQPLWNSQVGWAHGDPAVSGQSFTATTEETLLESIGIWFWAPRGELPEPIITIDLLEGAGFFGAIIASDIRVPKPGAMRWEDFDFRGVVLIPGAVYTFRITTDEGPNDGSTFTSYHNPYSGGTFFLGSGAADPEQDWTFRVLGSVPAPPTIVAVGLALFIRRRRRR